MEVGIFQVLPAPESVSDAGVVAQALDEVDFAEAHGFDAVWIAEHHFSSFGIVGAPSVYAAAVAQRTRRISVGYAVAVVPLHHPVRLAEEIAWVGHLSRGRLLVGVGPGFRESELGGYGIPLDERHARLEEGLAIVRGLFESEVYAHDGRYWTVPPVRLRPRPFGGAPPPFLRACSSPESLRRAAAAGEGVMLGLRSVDDIAESIRLYREIRAGAPAAAVDREVAGIRVLRRVAVAESGDRARAEALAALAWEADTEAARHVQAREGPAVSAEGPAPVSPPGSCFGTPREVRDEFEALYALGVRHVIAWLHFGNLPIPSTAIDGAPGERSRPAAPPGGACRRAGGGAPMRKTPESPMIAVERVQTGVRIEKRIVKVLKALADLLDLSLGDLLEGIVLHAFDGKAPFSPETRRKIDGLKKIYGLDLGADASHRLREHAPDGR